jgi:hypothetical protein
MPLRRVVSIVHVSYDQEFFHPSKHRVSQKWSLQSFKIHYTFQHTNRQTCSIKTQIYKSNALIPGRQFWLLKLQMLEWVRWQRSIYQSKNQCGFFLVFPEDALHNLKNLRALKKHNTCLCRHITILTKHLCLFSCDASWVSREWFLGIIGIFLKQRNDIFYAV